MLTAIPRNWYSWDFSLEGPGEQRIARLVISGFRERGSVVVDGRTYTIGRDGRLGPFTLTAPDGSLVVSAVKPSAFRREFVVTPTGGASYALKPVAPLRREFVLSRDGQEHGRVGSIAPVSWWRRQARVEFIEDLPAPVQAFLVWLTLLIWKRDSEMAS